MKNEIFITRGTIRVVGQQTYNYDGDAIQLMSDGSIRLWRQTTEQFDILPEDIVRQQIRNYLACAVIQSAFIATPLKEHVTEKQFNTIWIECNKILKQVWNET